MAQAESVIYSASKLLESGISMTSGKVVVTAELNGTHCRDPFVLSSMDCYSVIVI